MDTILEIILESSEVISSTSFTDSEKFDFEVLKHVDFKSIERYYIGKTLYDTIKAKESLSNGSNGATAVDLMNLFTVADIESYLIDLIQQKLIVSRQGINLKMYFTKNFKQKSELIFTNKK